MSERLPVCDCAEYYGSHPPDCPVRTLIESLQSQLTEALKPRVCRWRKRGTECGWNLPLHQPDGNFCEYCGGLIGVDNE